MQSSAMVALRTMIMITCLVAVPLAAVVGTALPKVVKSALDRRDSSFFSRDGVASDDRPAAVPHSDATDPVTPPPSEPELTDARAAPRLPSAHITGVRTIDDDAPAAPVVETAPLWNPSRRTASSPRNRDMTAHFAPSPLHGSEAAVRRRGEPRTNALKKTVYFEPDEDGPTQLSAPDAPDKEESLVPVERPAGDNPFADSERRLRELGAIYYRLETWGDEGRFYRCSCNVALSPRGRATRHFEAIDAAPSQAIGAVIKQVDAWRASKATR